MGISVGKIKADVSTNIDFILDTGEIEATWIYNSSNNTISSTGRDRFEVDIDNAENLLMVIDKWVGWIRNLTSPPETKEIEYPNSSEIKTKPNGDMTFDIVIGNMSISETWKKGDNFIELKPRNDFEISWDGILYFIKEQGQFLNMIREYQ